MKLKIALAVAAALVGTSLSALAAVPPVNFIEGVLTATGGGPAADGIYNLSFYIYKTESGGNPVYVEGPTPVAVKNGVFSHSLGSKTKLEPALLASLTQAWLAIKVENDAELPRALMHAVAYAQVAATAGGVDCSGCIKAGNLDPDALKDYAKLASLAKVATTGAFADLSGGPDLSGYAKKSELAKVAGTGQFSDLIGAPTLAKVATTGSYADLSNLPTLADVAKSGSYADLKNLPVLAKLGTSCGTGLVMKGIKDDGSYECTASLDSKTIAIDDITSGLMFFGETYPGKSVQIPDNRANSPEDKDIAIDKIVVPNIGLATKLSVTVELAKDTGDGKSNVADKRILLISPDNTVYTLFCGAVAGAFNVDGKPLCATTNNDKDYPFLKVYPKPDPVLIGDLTTWVGKNPAGTWTLKVHDYGFNGNGVDGKVNTWSINIHTYGSKKLNIKGNAAIENNVTIGGNLNIDGDLTVKGVNQYGMFPSGSTPFLYGRIVDHTQSNWVYEPIYQYAHSFALDSINLHRAFNQIIYGDVYGNVHMAFGGVNYGNGNEEYSRQYLMAFIKNTKTNDVTKSICYRWSSHPWAGGNYASIALNGSNKWSYTDNNLSTTCVDITFPASKTSVMILKTGSYMWTQWNGYYNKTVIGFYNDSLNFANTGLQFDYQKYQEFLQNTSWNNSWPK